MSTKKTRARSVKAKVSTSNTGSDVWVYIGPNIIGLVQTGKVYTGSREAVLAHPDVARAVDRIPLIKTMIVPVATLAQDRQNTNKPGTAMYQNYRRILAEAQRRNTNG